MQFSFRNQFGKGKRIIVLNLQQGSAPQHLRAPTLTDFLLRPQDQRLRCTLTSMHPCMFLEVTALSYCILFLKSLIPSLHLEEPSLSRLSNASGHLKSHQVTICICSKAGRQK